MPDITLIDRDDDLNINYVNQDKTTKGRLPFFGIFHSKLMLLEFDDRLRVVVTSANLYKMDWEQISNVTWL